MLHIFFLNFIKWSRSKKKKKYMKEKKSSNRKAFSRNKQFVLIFHFFKIPVEIMG